MSKKKVFFSWVWVGLCSLAIFISIPFLRTIQKFVSENWGSEFFLYSVLGSISIGFLGFVCFLIFKRGIRSPSKYIWLLVITSLYTYLTIKLRERPEEAVHFLEYGLLGFFLFKALSYHIRDKSIYFTATLFALFIGTFDEILQWITPQRYWDFRDVGLNGLSGGLFQLTVWKVYGPQIIFKKIDITSVRAFSRAFASCLLLLGLCASNTPHRVAYYTKHLPWLSFLQKEEPMSEFGFKYHDSEIGVFYSRLSPENLEETDKSKGKEYAQKLNKYVTMNYEQFLRKLNPIVNPFLYEFRIHVFRRDSYFAKANKTSSLNKRKEYYFVAYKENLILQKYFKLTTENSLFRWSNDTIEKSKVFIDENKFYKSPVSTNLFTAFSEKSIWISILLILMAVGIINLFYNRKNKKKNLYTP